MKEPITLLSEGPTSRVFYYLYKNGPSTTIQMVNQLMDLSYATIQQALDQLEEAKLIEREALSDIPEGGIYYPSIEGDFTFQKMDKFFFKKQF